MKVVVSLLMAGLAIGLVSASIQWRSLPSHPPLVVLAIGAGIPIALMSWISVKIWQGRNWARITTLVLLVAGLTLSIPQLPTMFEQGPSAVVLFALQTLTQLGAVWIMFLTPARRWFARTKSPTA